MKPKRRPLFHPSLFLSIAALPFLPTSVLSQSLNWAAAVNEVGNRDGTWSTSVVSWASTPGGTATTAWTGGEAVFSNAENGAVTLVGNITSKGITAGNGGSYTLKGNGQLVLTTGTKNPPAIHVGTDGAGVLTLDCNTTSSNTFSLVKTGGGTLRVNGWIMAPTLSLREGTTILSKSSFASNLENSANLVLNGDNTVSSYVQSSGLLLGNSTLKVSGSATLQGGTIAGNLSGNNITSSGLVDVTGYIGGNTLSVSGGTFTLTGRSGMQVIKIGSAGTFIDVNASLSESRPIVENQGIFRLEKDVGITKIVQSGGDLGGPGVLSAQSAYFTGGGISGSVTGDISISGNVSASGTLAGASLKINSGSLLLEGTLASQSVEINGGQLHSVNGGLGSGSNIVNKGVLLIDSDEIINNYTQTGSLDGKGTLKVTGLATVGGGRISNLDGDLLINGNTSLLGNCKGGNLTVSKGGLTINGTASHGQVSILQGAELRTSGGLSDAARVENAGWFRSNAAETVRSYTQTETGTFAADGSLTVLNTALLKGGNLYRGRLSGNDIRVSGTVQGWLPSRLEGKNLTITSNGFLNMSGIVDCENVTIESSGKLTTSDGGTGADSVVTNSGTWVLGADTAISRYIQKSGTIRTDNGSALTVADGLILDGGSVACSVQGLIRSNGDVSLFGPANGDELHVESGTLMVYGRADHSTIHISGGAALSDSGDLGNGSAVENQGALRVYGEDVIGSLTNHDGLVEVSGNLTVVGSTTFNGGELAGRLTAASGAALNDGTVIHGSLLGSVETNGRVTISGSTGGGPLSIHSGILKLTGSADSDTMVGQGATLLGNGDIRGNVRNLGTLATFSEGDRTLEIGGGLETHGRISMSVTDAGHHDQIQVAGVAALDGNLIVSNTGNGLGAGEIAQLISAGEIHGAFDRFQAVGFANGVLFDAATGRLVGMGGGEPGSASTYMNLNESQTDVYFSLYEDAVGKNERNVITDDENSPKSVGRHAKAGSPGSVTFTSGLADGAASLVDALNAATFTVPGTIYQPVLNRLSPEVHRGMADYTEQTLRSHGRQGMEAAPLSVSGKTRVFAVTHTSSDGVDGGGTEAGYDLQSSGVTAGVRYDLDQRLQLGGWFGGDIGGIQGDLVDTDARGLSLGVFGQYLAHEKTDTTVTAGFSCGGYDFDTERHSLMGDVASDDVRSDSFEVMIGARTTVYQNHGLRIMPDASLSYLGGSVDGFTENGSGVALKVGSQDIESLLLELGVNAEYKVCERVTLAGRIGYVSDFGDSGDSIHGAFAAAGTLARPFSVFAPGIDDDGMALGLGAYYDINETVRASFGYRGDFRFDAEDAHAFSLGLSFGF